MSGAAAADVDTDVLVVGAGIAGLTLAHDLARAGLRVTVCEASDDLGGLLRRGRLGGLDVDLGAESFATRTDAVAALIADADLDLRIDAPRPGGARLAIAGPTSGPAVVRAPLPRRTVLGIPADPLADDVVALIGAEAAARVAAEPELAMTEGDDTPEPSLLDLVAARCGEVLATRVVDTLCRSVYSRPAAELRLSTLHPGLWRAFRAQGSLVRAAGELAQDVRAGAAVAGIVGGMWRLPDALAAAARRQGASVRAGVPVTAIEGALGDGFLVRTPAGAISARRVVLATGPDAAAHLLGIGADATAPVGTDAGTDAGADPEAGTGTPASTPRAGRVRVVAAVVDHPGLDAFPVGSGVLVDPALPTIAKALTHVTAKWAWADEAAPAGRHIVRLSARDPEATGLDTAAGVAREVALLTGVDVAPADVRAVAVQEWPDAVAAVDPASLARRADARGVDLAGAAVAGTGLASVIPHARTLAAALAGAVPISVSTPAPPSRSFA